MQGFQLEIFPEGSVLIQRAIEVWQSRAAAAIRERGRFTVALAGKHPQAVVCCSRPNPRDPLATNLAVLGR